MKKAIYMIVGFVFLGIGAIGALVPLLPAFPFLLVATICFAKSSKKLHAWFIGTKLYKNNLESFIEKKGMSWKAKIRIMTVITLTMAFGFMMMGSVPVGRIILAIVWVFHIVYFIFFVKTSEHGEV